jgi:Flp pilus assembly pilin Flp
MQAAQTLAQRVWVAAVCRISMIRRDDERGAGLVEYALLVALIALVCIVAVTVVGRNTCGNFSKIPESAFSANNPTVC